MVNYRSKVLASMARHVGPNRFAASLCLVMAFGVLACSSRGALDHGKKDARDAASDVADASDISDAGAGQDTSTDTDAACTPMCENKTCGPDGCGGTCGPGCTFAEEICDAGQCTGRARVKVISYNIGCSCGETNTTMLEKVADLIVAEKADIAGVQEYWWDYAGADDPDTLAGLLNDRGYPMFSRYDKRFQVNSGKELGQIVLSKKPFEDFNVYRIQAGGGNKDIIQSFDYPLLSGKIRFFSVHPRPTVSCDVAPEMATHLKSYPGQSAIAVGDYNLIESNPCFDDLKTAYSNACAAVPDTTCEFTVDRTVWGGGVHAPPDLGAAIDFVWVTKTTDPPYTAPWKVISARADHDINDDVPVSDHLPVIAELELGQ